MPSQVVVVAVVEGEAVLWQQSRVVVVVETKNHSYVEYTAHSFAFVGQPLLHKFVKFVVLECAPWSLTSFESLLVIASAIFSPVGTQVT